MKKTALLLAFLLAPTTALAQPAPYKDIAAHWAPDIYHQTHSLDPKADWMTRFDFDGDWNAWNNWDNLHHFPLPAALYYQVSETKTHWFIYYGVFHPRDWEPGLDNGFISHENDLEDMLFVVKKGKGMGKLELIETQAHREFLPYSNQKLKTKHMPSFGTLKTREHRPLVYVPTGGHGVYGYTGQKGDILLYKYTGKAEVSTLKSKSVGYGLVPISDLWKRRYDFGKGQPFVSFATFGADDHTWINSAVAPWGHDDPNDGPVRTGDIFSDPAYMISQHFEMPLPFSHDYLKEAPHTRKVHLNSLHLDHTLPDKSRVRFELIVNGQLSWSAPYERISERQWKIPRLAKQKRYIALAPGSKVMGRWIGTSSGLFQKDSILAEVKVRSERQDFSGIFIENKIIIPTLRLP